MMAGQQERKDSRNEKNEKINGFLIVRFNDRERREFPGLGAFGVIEAELYTGHIDCDRGVLEYEDAESMEEAVEQARGLESELDVEEPATTYTVIKETDMATVEEEINPQLLISGWETNLERQIKSGHYPNVNPMTARHELYGFKVALKELGLLDAEDCYVLPGTFGPEDSDAASMFYAKKASLENQINSPHYPDTDERTAAHELYAYALALQDLGLIQENDGRFFVTPDTFKGAQQRKRFENLRPTQDPRVYALGLALSIDCPDNDCRVYLNIFNMARELDAALDTAKGHVDNTLRRELLKLYQELREMLMENYAVRKYKEAMKS